MAGTPACGPRYRLTELEPGARIVLLEADICGGGPSGRNGGFATSWWDEFPTLVERYGDDRRASRSARRWRPPSTSSASWCATHGVDAWYTKAGSLSASAAPAQDGAWDEAVEALPRARSSGDRLVPLTADEVAARVRSPVFRAGVFMPGAATIQPATLARGLRRVLLERGVVDPRGHDGRRDRRPRPGWLGGVGAGARRAPRAAGPARRPRRSASARARRRATARSLAGSAILALNAWAAAWPWFGRRLVTWSSYIVLTEPIPDRLADLGWTGGEGLADARFTLHYLRTTPDGRIAIGGGGGRAGFGGASAPAFTDDARSRGRARPRACGGCSRRCATCGSRTPGAARSTSRADHLPWFGSVSGRPIHYGHGYSGNGVAPSRRRRADPGGARRRAPRRPGAGAAARRRRAAAAVPARAVPLRSGRGSSARPRSAARPTRSGASRRARSSRGQPAAAAARLPPRAGIGRAERPGPSGAGIGPNRLECSAPRRTSRCRRFLCRSPSLNSRPPVKPAIANEPFKHVIDEYKHQAQTITCTCGWHGSSATIDRGGSEWTAHLLEVRGKKR